MRTLQMNSQWKYALKQLQEGKKHLFITGKAGTGKSTLLSYYRDHTENNVVVLAPTGVAAVNVDGETIHSFFHFSPSITPSEARTLGYKNFESELYTTVDTIIIDEISMVRADLLDCVDAFLRSARKSHHPFGGVRMIFFGDLYQLPPVVTRDEVDIFRTQYQSEWFFDSNIMQAIFAEYDDEFELIELDTIFRQSDQEFIDLLNHIRLQTIEPKHFLRLNQRVQTYSPSQTSSKTKHPPITLTGRRDTAARMNAQQLDELHGQLHTYSGRVVGKFPDGHLPTETELSFKNGARVMFVANDPEGRYVNGTLGTIKSCTDEVITVKLDSGKTEDITPHTWELTHTVVTDTRELKKEKLGTFTQFPLMLAWAVTIHKSQGKTFDNVIINMERGAFAFGQTYVALSRCKTFEGIVLSHPLSQKDVQMNTRIGKFFVSFAIRRANRIQPSEEKVQRILDAIEMQSQITIVYLKAHNDESTQIVTPKRLDHMQFGGSTFPGLEAYTAENQEPLTFNLERILYVQ